MRNAFLAVIINAFIIALAPYSSKAETLTDSIGTMEIILTIGSNTYSQNGVSHSLDVPPYISKDNRTMVPIRFIAEGLGAEVTWVDKQKTDIIELNGKTVYCKVGEALEDNMGTPIIKDDRLFVPIRYIVTKLGADVDWDAKERKVTITMGSESNKISVNFTITELMFNGDELYKVIGGGTADSKFMATMQIPPDWGYVKNLDAVSDKTRDGSYIGNVGLYNFSSNYELPNAMLPYSTKDNDYDANLAKHIVSNAKLTISNREVLAEHISMEELYGWHMYRHVYYIRVDDDYVLHISITSPTMDGEAVRQQVVGSVVFSHS
jgi:hypothetical protein